MTRAGRTLAQAGAERPADRALTSAYAIGAAAFVAFAVWGSLFPFDFHRVPLETAAGRFWSQWAVDPGPWSLTDLLSNVLLFLPIGLLLSAAGEGLTRGKTNAAAVATITVAAAAALSGAIEFAQAFVSWRTPSIVDVAAEVTGVVCGIGFWRYVRAEVDGMLRACLFALRRSSRDERLLLAFCAVFAIIWWIPADFTLRPEEIGDKYAHKRLLLPFTPSPDAATPSQLAVTAAAGVPLGLAAVLCACAPGTRRSAASGAVLAAVALIGVEAIQVPVFSRTTDTTSLLAALSGSTIGAVAASFASARSATGIDRHMVAIGAALAVWVGVVLAIEWWPFQVVLDPARARLQAMLWSRAPFRLPGSVLDVLPGAVFAAATGVFARSRLDPRFVRLQTMMLVGFTAAALTVCEAGRLLLVDGRPTLLSVLLKLLAMTVGLSVGTMPSPSRLRPDHAR